MKNTYRTLFFMFLLISLNLNAQISEKDSNMADSVKQWQLVTIDGNEYIGTIVNQDSNEIVFNTKNIQKLIVKRTTIKQLKRIDINQMKNGQFWYDSPHATRYFWSPNGYGLRKGEGYYQNTWVFLNQFSVGITNNLSAGFGFVPTFLFGGESNIPFWVTPKISIPLRKDKSNLGIGLLYMDVTGNDESGALGIAYGVFTLGSKDNNTTFGLGYGLNRDGLAKLPTLTFSGMYRVSKKFYFLTENWVLPVGDNETYGLLSAGGRYGGQGIAIDFGLIIPLTGFADQGLIALPWLGINVPIIFRKNKS